MMLTKTCRECKKIKQTIDFRIRRNICKNCESFLVLKRRNPKDHARTNGSWNHNNPDKVRNMTLIRLYGITLEQYNLILKNQGGTCAVCDATDSGPSRKNPLKTEPLFVDHCHTTKKVRGLLCRKHNTAIGLLNDSSKVMKKIMSYLE